MYNFCTLFDSNYLSRGIAMFESLKQHCSDFHLYVFAFDEACDRILRGLALPHVTVISLRDFEDEKLLEVKPSRSRAEYCWTCTSSSILYVLEKFGVDSCTYLDADLYFLSSPHIFFEEMGVNSILITEHRYTKRYDKSKKSGKYCVQFIFFRNDEKGLRALRWWRERCLEWCYARVEDGKFGDQMYLDDWTDRFQGVHVLRHLGGGLAPWNVQQYSFFKKEGRLFGRELKSANEFEAVFYHFHYVRFFHNGVLELGRRVLSNEVRTLIYKPYIRHLEDVKTRIRAIDSSLDPHGTTRYGWTWKTPILYVSRTLARSYNLFGKGQFIEE